MGAREEAPPLPMTEPLLLPEGETRIAWVQRECNWLQALEGDLDTSHVGFLHEGKVSPEAYPSDATHRHAIKNRAPVILVSDTEWGTMYAARRPADPGDSYYRMAQFLFPFWTMVPNGDFQHNVEARAWVPMDDTHTMFLSVSWKSGAASE